MHAYISLRGDEGVKTVHAYISLRGDEGVKQCTHTLACVVMKGLNSARYISLRGDEGVKRIH